jgi:hypothetical protein
VTIYHTLTWNFNELPKDVLYVANETQKVLQPYIDKGYTGADDAYWEPHTQDVLPKSGIRVRYRRWSDKDQCFKYVSEINALRNQDPVKSLILSEAEVHNDDNYKT